MSWTINYWDKASNVLEPPKRPENLWILCGWIVRDIDSWANVIREHVWENNERRFLRVRSSESNNGRHSPCFVIPPLKQHRSSRLEAIKRPSQSRKDYNNFRE